MLTTDKVAQLLQKVAGINEYNFFEMPVHEIPFAKVTALLDKNGIDARNFIDMYNDTTEGMLSTRDVGETTWTPSSNLMDMSWEEFLEHIASISI